MNKEEEKLAKIREKAIEAIKEITDEEDEVLSSILIESIKSGIEEYKEEMIEDEELSRRYESRLDLPEDQWEEIPEGMTIMEWFESNRVEGESNDRKKK